MLRSARGISWLPFFLLALVPCARVVALDVVPGRTHVFVDTDGLQDVQNCSIRLHEPRKTYEAVLVSEFPWEAGVYMYTSALVVKNASLGTAELRLYYACYAAHHEGGQFVCVAVSKDGLRFEKPLLPYFPWTDGSPTNRVWQTSAEGYFGNVARVGPAFVLASEDSYTGRTVALAVSDDGLRFRNASGVASLPPGFADTQVNLVPPSELAGGNVTVFGRHDEELHPCPHSNWGNFRRVAVSTAGNLSGPFAPPLQALYVTPPLDPAYCYDPYNPAAVQYGDALLLLPSMSYHRPDYANRAPGGERISGNDAVMDVRLAASRRAYGAFSYVSRKPFLPRGVGYVDPVSLLFNASGSDPDSGFLFFTANGVVDPDELLGAPPPAMPSPRLHLYYWATQATHAWNGMLEEVWPGAFVGVLRATMRRDGFASISTLSDDPTALPNGTFSTQPLTLPACPSDGELRLLLNAHTSTAGWVFVGLRNATTGKPLPGFSSADAVGFKGNAIRVAARWNATGTPTSSLAPLAGESVRVDVLLSAAEVFAYEFACQSQ